jgi:hypothetical protein
MLRSLPKKPPKHKHDYDVYSARGMADCRDPRRSGEYGGGGAMMIIPDQDHLIRSAIRIIVTEEEAGAHVHVRNLMVGMAHREQNAMIQIGGRDGAQDPGRRNGLGTPVIGGIETIMKVGDGRGAALALGMNETVVDTKTMRSGSTGRGRVADQRLGMTVAQLESQSAEKESTIGKSNQKKMVGVTARSLIRLAVRVLHFRTLLMR